MSRLFATLFTCLFTCVPLSAAFALDAPHEPQHEPPSEALRVTLEACGSDPTASCLSELRKVCKAHPTFRCYYSFKGRLDTIRTVGFSTGRHDRDEEE